MHPPTTHINPQDPEIGTEYEASSEESVSAPEIQCASAKYSAISIPEGVLFTHPFFPLFAQREAEQSLYSRAWLSHYSSHVVF